MLGGAVRRVNAASRGDTESAAALGAPLVSEPSACPESSRTRTSRSPAPARPPSR